MNWRNDKILELEIAGGDYHYIDSSKIVLITTGYWPHLRISLTINNKPNELLIDASLGKNIKEIESLTGFTLKFNPTSKVFNRPSPIISEPTKYET